MNWGNDMAGIACVLLATLLLVGACEKRALVRNNCLDSSVCVEGNPPSPDASQPTYRESTEHFVQISAGVEEACGIRMDGSIRCWGSYGDCRDVDGECPVQRGSVAKPTAGAWKYVSVGQNYACAIRTDDSIDCWGWLKTAAHFDGGSFAGWLDNPAHLDGAFSALAIPFAIRKEDGSILGLINARQPPAGSFLAASGDGYCCAIKSDGTLTCWGSARNDGITDQPPSGTFNQLVTASDFGCALQVDGQVSCWGWGTASWDRNGSGFVPQPDGTFVQLAAYAMAVCGVRKDGGVTCWGELSGYVPPEGNYLQVAVGLTSLDAPDYGAAFFCALRPDGVAVCWDGNNSGESSPP